MSVQAESAGIHPTAVVSSEAELGEDVSIGPYCVVEAGVRLGPRVRLAPYVHVLGSVLVGAGTEIGTGSVVGGPPQDTKYGGEVTEVRLGEDCRLFEHVTVHRATGEGESTIVGDRVMLMTGSHIGHNARIGDDVVLVNGALVAGHGRVGDRAMLSGNAALHQFCRVGRLSLVGGACMATKDIPPFSIASGSYPVRWRAPNTVGLRRAGLSSEQRTELRRAFGRLFLAGESPVRVARELEDSTSSEVAELARFITESSRGICSPPERFSAGD